MDLLIVEDEAVLGKAVQRGLQEAGHKCEWARTGGGVWLPLATVHAAT